MSFCHRDGVERQKALINKASDDLSEETAYSAQFRAEQQTELRSIAQIYQKMLSKWQSKLRLSPFRRLDVSLHQNELKRVYTITTTGLVDEDKHQGEMPSKIALGRMGHLCHHVHLMTRIEVFAETIHAEYRGIANWMHEYSEETESVTREVQSEVEKLQTEIKENQAQHKRRMLDLEEHRLEARIVILLEILSERRKESIVISERPTSVVTTKDRTFLESESSHTVDSQKSFQSVDLLEPSLVVGNPQEVPV